MITRVIYAPAKQIKVIKMSPLVKKIGKKLVVKMADIMPSERRAYLAKKIYKRRNCLCHYTNNTINVKVSAMNILEMTGGLDEALYDVYDNSPRLDRRVRSDAAIQRRKINPAAVFPNPKVKFKPKSKK